MKPKKINFKKKSFVQPQKMNRRYLTVLTIRWLTIRGYNYNNVDFKQLLVTMWPSFLALVQTKGSISDCLNYVLTTINKQELS